MSSVISCLIFSKIQKLALGTKNKKITGAIQEKK